MNWYFLSDIWHVVLLFVVAAAIALTIGLPSALIKVPWFQAAFPLIALATLGLVSGVMTGQSRDPAVTAVLPALLGIVGGALTLLLTGRKDATGAKISKVDAKGVSVAVMVLAIAILLGAKWGARSRELFEQSRASEEYAAYVADVKFRTCVKQLDYERLLLATRSALELPPAAVTIAPECFGKLEGGGDSKK